MKENAYLFILQLPHSTERLNLKKQTQVISPESYDLISLRRFWLRYMLLMKLLKHFTESIKKLDLDCCYFIIII